MSSVLVEANIPVATALWSILSTQISAGQPITLFKHITHQHVLDCGAADDFHSFLGVLYAELNAELLRLSKIFIFTFFILIFFSLCVF